MKYIEYTYKMCAYYVCRIVGSKAISTYCFSLLIWAEKTGPPRGIVGTIRCGFLNETYSPHEFRRIFIFDV